VSHRGGIWIGRAAADLGLAGPVDPDALVTVLDGRHPWSGVRLRSERVGVLAYDLTFSAPKSASVLMALGDQAVAQHVVDAHHDAVAGALEYLETHGITVSRRAGPERPVLATDGAVAAAFTHGVNRNGDPHLHSHVVLANLVHAEDGRWSALDQRGLTAHRLAASGVYQAHLRAELVERCGVRWSVAPLAVSATAEIDGVSPLVRAEFSSRAAAIRQHRFEHGVHSRAGDRIAWAVTRADKGPSRAFDSLTPEWHRRAVEISGAPLDLGAVLGRPPVRNPTVSEHQYGSVLAPCRDTGIHRRDLVEAFGAGTPEGVRHGALKQLTDLWTPSPAGVGVAEDAQPWHATMPSRHALTALGPRPTEVASHGVWVAAARDIDRYRQRWSVRGDEVLGTTQCSPTWGSARMVDHLRTAAALETARARLGRREPWTLVIDRGR
jgi:conjugative relaxase-like TrwC/TraI family protein